MLLFCRPSLSIVLATRASALISFSPFNKQYQHLVAFRCSNKNVTNLHNYLKMKNNSFARFARAFFIFFDISQTFSFFPRREMTYLTVNFVDDVSIS